MYDLIMAGYVQGLSDASKILVAIAHMYEYGEDLESVFEEVKRCYGLLRSVAPQPCRWNRAAQAAYLQHKGNHGRAVVHL